MCQLTFENDAVAIAAAANVIKNKKPNSHCSVLGDLDSAINKIDEMLRSAKNVKNQLETRTEGLRA